MRMLWVTLVIAAALPAGLGAQEDSPRRSRQRAWAGQWEALDLSDQQRERLRALMEERRELLRKHFEESRERMGSVLTDEQRQRLEGLRQERQNRRLLRQERARRDMVRREYDRMLWRRDDLRRTLDRAFDHRYWDDWHQPRPRFRRYPL